MSEVTVRKTLKPKAQDPKKTLQACELGGSLYGKVSSRSGDSGSGAKDTQNNLSLDYKNFYRSQSNTMSRLFGKNTK